MPSTSKLEKILSDPSSLDRMKHIDGLVAKAVLPFRANTEAMIVVFALLRVARVLFKLYSPDTQRALVTDVIIPFFAVEEKQEGLIKGLFH